jgi:phage shock protein C
VFTPCCAEPVPLTVYATLGGTFAALGTVALTLMGIGFIPLIYFGLGFFSERKPQHLYYTDRQEQQFWQGVRQSPTRTAREVRARPRRTRER